MVEMFLKFSVWLGELSVVNVSIHYMYKQKLRWDEKNRASLLY